MKEKFRDFLDNIFQPPHAFLDIARDKLQNIQLVTAQGLNIGKHLSIFGDMPGAWQIVIVSMLAMVVILGGLLMFRSGMRIYYAVKEGVKWW